MKAFPILVLFLVAGSVIAMTGGCSASATDVAQEEARSSRRAISGSTS